MNISKNCLLIVLKYIPNDDIEAFGLVCRKWYGLIKKEYRKIHGRIRITLAAIKNKTKSYYNTIPVYHFDAIYINLINYPIFKRVKISGLKFNVKFHHLEDLTIVDSEAVVIDTTACQNLATITVLNSGWIKIICCKNTKVQRF